jgi:hypothetical protein
MPGWLATTIAKVETSGGLGIRVSRASAFRRATHDRARDRSRMAETPFGSVQEARSVRGRMLPNQQVDPAVADSSLQWSPHPLAARRWQRTTLEKY